MDEVNVTPGYLKRKFPNNQAMWAVIDYIKRPGATMSVYIAYASDDIGTDFTLTPNPDLKFMAILLTNVKIVTPVAADFVGLWRRCDGEITITVQDGWLCWQYIGDTNWTQLYQVPTALLKATGAEVTTGTDDAKYLTPKSVTDSNILQSSDSTVKNEIALTQAAYDALITKPTTTVYLIIG